MSETETDAASVGSFQTRVDKWLLACFGEVIARDKVERNHRFIEEALELVQANGCTQSEAHQLVDYVYGRPMGELYQEVGGVMNTLAALCLANGIDLDEAAEAELARVWTKVEKIRTKQAAKPKHSPLPEAKPDAAFVVTDEMIGTALAGWDSKAGYSQIEKIRAALTAALSLRSPATIPAPTFGPDLRCPECQCASFARINERKFDGSFGPGPHIRCVDCKRVYAYRRIAVVDVLGRSEIPTPATIPAAVDAVAIVERLRNDWVKAEGEKSIGVTSADMILEALREAKL